jgi:hypothetical protein
LPVISTVVLFVRHDEVEAFLRLGWSYGGPAPGPHGAWSCVLEWRCACAMPLPINSAAGERQRMREAVAAQR